MTNDYGNLELHKVLLSAMKDIDKICRENGLRYYLYAGTLLGAVNHKGFIPWDDDVDIVMFPEEFKKFSEVISRDYSERYELHSFDNDPTFYTRMNALWIKGTEVTTGESKHQIYVDVQILHNVPDRKTARFLQQKEVELINMVLCAQSGHIVPTSLPSRIILGNLARIKRERLGKRLQTVLQRYDNTDTEYVGIMCNTMTPNPYTGRSGYETDFTKRVWHENFQYVEFEDTLLMTFSNIEDYLDYQFSPKWREPYPEEKRVTKHGMKNYYIEPWVRERIER